MAAPSLYNVLLGFGWARERFELVKATLDPGLPVAGAAGACVSLIGVRRAFDHGGT